MTTGHRYKGSDKPLACPYCGFLFRALLANASKLPTFAPIVCESCAEVGLLEEGETRKLSPEELESLKESEAWKSFIVPAVEVINRNRAKRS